MLSNFSGTTFWLSSNRFARSPRMKCNIHFGMIAKAGRFNIRAKVRLNLCCFMGFGAVKLNEPWHSE